MDIIIGVIVGIIVIVIAARQALLHREVRQHHSEPFDGVVYAVGKAAVAERRGRNPRATVVGMHGFCEDLRYFTRYYDDPDVQLILVNSCDYHLPIAQPQYQGADWASAPSDPEGTIEYDAHVLVQALEHLPVTDAVRVHGHSRGGAVILEAASLRPDLFQRAEVVLEAPVLPQGESTTPVTRVLLWMVPFVAALWRMRPISPLNRGLYGSLDNPRKRELITGLPFNPKRPSTMISNIRSLESWMTGRQYEIYRHVGRGVVLVPERDKVLVPGAMADSARRAAPNLDMVTVEGSSHFVLMDRPDALPALPQAVRQSATAG